VGNKEISDLVNVLGTSFGKNFNIEKLKYHKIILAPDADVDGKVICQHQDKFN
jgi:DNA gyrase subunit B